MATPSLKSCTASTKEDGPFMRARQFRRSWGKSRPRGKGVSVERTWGTMFENKKLPVWEYNHHNHLPVRYSAKPAQSSDLYGYEKPRKALRVGKWIFVLLCVICQGLVVEKTECSELFVILPTKISMVGVAKDVIVANRTNNFHISNIVEFTIKRPCILSSGLNCISPNGASFLLITSEMFGISSVLHG